MKNIFTLLLITAISFTSYAQEWETVENRGPDGCYTTQIIETVEIKKKTALDSEKYHYIIKITFENPLDVGISFDFRYHDSYGENTGRITLKPGKKTTSEVYREISKNVDWKTALNIQPIETSKLKYIDFEILGEKIWQSEYINCLEHFHLYKKKKMKEIRDKKENGNKDEKSDNIKQTTKTSKKRVDNETTEAKGYEVLDVDTSEFEAEKLRNQKLLEEQTKNRDEETLKKENKAKFKAKQLEDAQNFIANQNAATEKYDAALKNLGNSLTTEFTEMSNSWAREQDYINQISSLSQIKSTSVTGIIKEARQKQKQLEDVFNRKARDLDKELATSRTRVLAAAKNETQAAVGELLATTATVLARRKLQKDEREARQNLERQKERELSKIAEKLKEKYYPIKSQSLEAATLAVKEETELYYLKKYEFANCMIENANDIIRGSSSYCNDPKTKNSINKKHTGQSYYEAYKRKSKSLIPEIQNKAGYFLELAINKEPTNTKWLLEKLDKFELSTKQQLAIMKHCLEIDQKNLKLKKKYTKKLRLYSNMKYAIESNKNDVNKVDVNKIKEQKLKDLNPEFEDVKFVSNNVFLISKFSGKIIKVKSRSILGDKFSKKLYGLVDSLGNIIAPMKYNEIGVFSEGKATALIKKKYGFINLKGETVIPFEFKYKPSEFKNGYSIIYKLDKVWKLMFSEEKTFKLFIDSSGKEINGKKYDALNDFSEGLALAEKSKLNSYEQNFIDKKGNVVIPLDKYYGVKSFSEGLAAVQIKSKKAREQSIQKWGFINTSGDVIIDCVYDNVTSFVNNQATVQKNNKEGIIDKQNAIVIPIEYDKIFDFVNGYALIVLDNKMGLINKQNEIIVPPIYDARYYNNDMNFGAIIPNYIFLKKNNKWGVLNKNGEVAVDFKYNNKETIFELFD
ncbi:hypothetical protein FPF71_14045 [Algibacter amylolyticus]|uniref:WG repeat-containing protein n=1 Tax=Algibacter amylolyticus TaxID=1608400 RepID=A0A5M7B675_9FLAO|nr:WG repeat-containing protein [Algibacter amylolyticus]KAA5823808.1 hypothetical protein F2B50_14045 [Algibacter amylolyticus]MBB5267983.1 hypothetical protein [Algibacter amylolyticus]TSJ74296.1 hypothetical protein FPF71_14045 [Algibacter amylolyticus]